MGVKEGDEVIVAGADISEFDVVIDLELKEICKPTAMPIESSKTVKTAAAAILNQNFLLRFGFAFIISSLS